MLAWSISEIFQEVFKKEKKGKLSGCMWENQVLSSSKPTTAYKACCAQTLQPTGGTDGHGARMARVALQPAHPAWCSMKYCFVLPRHFQAMASQHFPDIPNESPWYLRSQRSWCHTRYPARCKGDTEPGWDQASSSPWDWHKGQHAQGVLQIVSFREASTPS